MGEPSDRPPPARTASGEADPGPRPACPREKGFQGLGRSGPAARPPFWERFPRLGAVVTEGPFGVGFGAVCVERVSESSSLCREGERVGLESESGGHSGLLDSLP